MKIHIGIFFNINLINVQINMNKEKKFFNKLQSDYIFTYLLSFFNLSDIRSIFPLSKRFFTILNKDNKKIIRDIQKKIFSTELTNELILNHQKYKLTSFPFNNSPILNSIIMDHFLLSSSCQFDNGFSVYDLNKNKLSQRISFKDKNYSYVSTMMYIKEKKIVLIGTNNGYLVSYFLDGNNTLNHFWEYKTGFNKEIKNIIYFKSQEKILIISLDSDESINLNFLRIFYIECSNEKKFDENKNDIKYIKSYIIKDKLVYNIKYFSREKDKNNNNTGFICLALNKGELNYDNNNMNNIFTKDRIKNNTLEIINTSKININFSNFEKNYEYLIKNNTYEELDFDFSLKGHKSYISDFLFLQKNNFILSVEYLSPYLFIWDINIKQKIKSVLLPHIDSILCLLNISDKYILSSGRDRKIFVYDDINDILKENSNLNMKEIKCNHFSDIYKLNYYNENNINKIISSSFDKTIKIFIAKDYNFDSMTKIIITGHSSPIYCVKIDSLRNQILTIDINCIINIWEYNKNYNIYTIIKSIEINSVKGKKEYIEDIILLYDNLNSIIKIDRTKKIKIYSLSQEQLLYEYSEENENILKILDFCNFREFVCYTSKNKIILYNFIIAYQENKLKYEIKKIKDIDINDEILLLNKNKMTCFELLSWKYKLIGIGYNNNKILIIKFNDSKDKTKNIIYEKYIVDIDSYLNNGFNHNNMNDIKQIKCVDYTNKKIKEKFNKDFFLYIVFSVSNGFFIFNIISDFTKINIYFVDKIQSMQNINYFDIINKNLIIASFVNNYKIEIINFEKNEKEKNERQIKELLFDIDIFEENINKIVFTYNKKGIFLISNNSIKYLEFI